MRTINSFLIAIIISCTINVWATEPVPYNFNNFNLNKELVNLYEEKPSLWHGDHLLIIAIGYALEKQFSKAEDVYNKILIETPNNIRAIRGMGNVLMLQGKIEMAEKKFILGWSMEDVPSLRHLISLYIASDQYNKITKYVPDILVYKNNDLILCKLLIVYSIKMIPPSKTYFMKAIEGVSDDDILSMRDASELVLSGYKIFNLGNYQSPLKEKLLESIDKNN